MLALFVAQRAAHVGKHDEPMRPARQSEIAAP